MLILPLVSLPISFLDVRQNYFLYNIPALRLKNDLLRREIKKKSVNRCFEQDIRGECVEFEIQ